MSKPSPPLTQQERLAIHHRRFQKMGQPAAAPPSPPTQGEEVLAVLGDPRVGVHLGPDGAYLTGSAPPPPSTQSEEEFDGPIMAQLVRNNAALRAQNAELVAERDGAVATLEDEEAAHADTLRLWNDAKARNAELVAALEKAWPYVATAGTATDWARDNLIAKIDAALAAAGRTP